MPIWSEVLALCVAAYALGLAAGFFIWGRDASSKE